MKGMPLERSRRAVSFARLPCQAYSSTPCVRARHGGSHGRSATLSSRGDPRAVARSCPAGRRLRRAPHARKCTVTPGREGDISGSTVGLPGGTRNRCAWTITGKRYMNDAPTKPLFAGAAKAVAHGCLRTIERGAGAAHQARHAQMEPELKQLECGASRSFARPNEAMGSATKISAPAPGRRDIVVKARTPLSSPRAKRGMPTASGTKSVLNCAAQWRGEDPKGCC